jgi:pyridoxamine 5'-phosphate oxidase
MVVTSLTELIERFNDWMIDAEKAELNDPTAMSLATTTTNGQPSLRMVLLKAVDEKGFVFYTNYESQKGEELLANPQAAICFHWKSLRRQVRVEGDVEQVTDAEADAYFDSRARDSRIGAWASQQSRAMADRFSLEKSVAKYAAKYAIGSIPRPDYWSGFRIVPKKIEFWRDRPFRLHERKVYKPSDDGWYEQIYFP